MSRVQPRRLVNTTREVPRRFLEMPNTSNSRTDSRRRTLLGGKIFDDEGRSEECLIGDLSIAGARVKSAFVAVHGSRVSLKIDKFKDIRGADVVWIRDGWIGLRFVEKIRHASPAMRKVFELMKRDADAETRTD